MTRLIRPKTKNIVALGLLASFGAMVLTPGVARAQNTEKQNTDQAPALLEETQLMSLKSDIRVDRSFVTLGDLFHLSGKSAEINVVRSPAPGAKLAISARALERFVYRQDMKWDNALRLQQVIVTRNSTQVRAKDVRAALQMAFEDMGLDTAIDIKLHTRQLVIHLPSNMARELSIETLNHDMATGRFSAEIRTPLDNGASTVTAISGQTINVQLVPILAHPVPRGAVVTEADLTMERIATKRMGANIVSAMTDIVGMETKRALRPGQPLRATDLVPPTLIKKGARVTMTFKADGLYLTNIGRALETGGMGDTINVTNPRSRQTVMAKIIGTNHVSVTVGGLQLAAAR